MTLSSITFAVRAAKGEILALGPTTFGFVIRANINGRSCRIISSKTGQKAQIIPQERGCETHVVSDAPSLQTWLSSISNT